MSKPNINDAFKIPKDFLIGTGHWPLANPSIFNRFKCLLSWLIEIIFEIGLFMELYKHFNDITVLTDHMSILTSPTSFFIKLIIYRLNHKQLKVMLEQLNFTEFNNYPEHSEGHMVKAIKFSRFMGIMYQWICGVVIINYSIFIPVLTGHLPVRFTFDVGYWKSAVYVSQVLGKIIFVNCCRK